ncbi:unnamed protein product [Rotaria socialis]|uniref:FAT domain-containing protein n=1 Tax=Rotaria socialis TaxID=392032 RepID=A0A821SLL8_9BILA|nr:unnamed protein product [Rotaria socialis]
MYIVIFISEALRFFAWSIDNNTKKVEAPPSEQTNGSSTSSSSGEVNVSTDNGDWWCDLHRCGLLLQLITVKFFCITNKSTCCEWLNRIRIPIILTALRSGQYESAARNFNQYLLHTCSLGQAEASKFEFVIISFVQSLIKLHNSMAIHGIYVWLKNIHQLDWSWIQVCEHEAAGNLEQATYEYKLLLNEHFKSLLMINEKKEDKISGGLVKFLIQKVYDCYLSLHQWPELIAWNDTYIKMQMAFLQDDNEDLRTAMETTIDINAIRAMSCFENRDFEGLKVSMRKMPNSQATGEELGRSLSCGWDMEAFDMLATVETLRGVSKRRSGLWSLNAILQLTRIHNVDEHASWSEERAAISQVAALYQSENRKVPLLPGQKFAPVQHSVRALNYILLYSQLSSNNQKIYDILLNGHVLQLKVIMKQQQIMLCEFGKLCQLRKQYIITGLGVDIAGEPFVRKNIPLDELLIGELLDFSTLTRPNLAKSWFRFADWAYLWGRQLLALSIPYEVSSDELTEISRILSSIRILNDDDSELTASELSSLHSYRTDLSRALIQIRIKKNNDTFNVLVTLHLLHVLVRYPQQLRTNGWAIANKSAAIHYGPPVIFETKLLNSPTVAWKRLIPQLFSHLNHPDSSARDYLTNLLIRIAKDFPQLILYSVVVGITDDSKMRRIKSRDDNIYQRKSASTHESEDEKSENDIDEDDEEEDDIEKQENAVAMQNSFRLIYNVLSETNSHLVGQVKLFIHELRRVTVLWNEL